MHVEIKKYDDGKIYMYLRGKEYKNGKWVAIKSQPIGYVHEFLDRYDDPLQHFRDYYKQLTKQQKAQELIDESKITLTFDINEKIKPGTSFTRNIGYVAFKRMYKELELDKFWKKISRKYNFEYDLEKIFYLLVISRLMDPGSKKYTFDHKDQYFEPIEGFELEDMRCFTLPSMR